MNIALQIVFWLFVTLLLVGFLYMFSAVLTPFVLGFAIAYLLNPLVEEVRSFTKMPRWGAAAIILFFFFLVITALALLFGPVVARELADLIKQLPSYGERAWQELEPFVDTIRSQLGIDVPSTEKIAEQVQSNLGQALTVGKNVLSGIITGGAAVVSVLVTTALTPIIAFYVLIEWPVITSWISNIWPRNRAEEINTLLSKIDRKIAAFIRGQLTVCFVLAMMYALGLAAVGLNYGFLIGMIAGIACIIPIAGSFIGLVTGVTVALFQTGDFTLPVIVACVFFLGQFIEGNFLSPKLLGDSVGLHPLWIIFALMAGGSVYGIIGMLVAVPIAAAISVLLNYAIQKYRESDLYLRHPQTPPQITQIPENPNA